MTTSLSYGGRIAALAAQFAGVYATSWPLRGPEERAALIDSFVLDLTISGAEYVYASDLNLLRARVSDELAACHAMASPHARPALNAPDVPDVNTKPVDAPLTVAQIRQLNPDMLAAMLTAGRAWLAPSMHRVLVATLRLGGRVVAGRSQARGELAINAATLRALIARGYLDYEPTSLGGYGARLSDRTRATIVAIWRDWSTKEADRRMSWRSLSDREVVVLRPDGGPHLKIVCEMASDEELARAADAVVAAGMSSRDPTTT